MDPKIDSEEADLEENKILQEDKQILLALERTRLSNERTFLSWIRTAIACIGGGVAIIRLINFNQESHKLVAQIAGDILIGIGILFLVFSLINFKQLNHQIPNVSKDLESTSYIITISAIVLIILAIALILII
ncbi:MAG TPA: DUF202 domain-containing protein [Parachlamydiaceae bacterium]|nr:DUF202 domain-containing protein [Parachlamydiaceae bacterium]